METTTELLYLLEFADKDNKFFCTNTVGKSECVQWMTFWHGSGAPYQGQLNHFNTAAPEKMQCRSSYIVTALLFPRC